MKKESLMILLFMVFNNTLYSQKKVEMFYNSNLENISKEDFEFYLAKENYRSNAFELKDQLAYVLYLKKTKGKLSKEELTKLNESLLKKGTIDNPISVIIYYPGKDWCNGTERISTWNIFNADYSSKLRRINKTNNFWVYKSDENLRYYHPKKVDWKKDDDQIIEKIFFKIHYPCFSSAVIDKDGNYILNLGEFGKDEIWEDVKELTK